MEIGEVTQIGMVGLGKMGFNMRERLRERGIEVVGFDSGNSMISDAPSLTKMLDMIPSPRVVWVMVPSGDATQAVITRLDGLLEAGDIVIDGGNSKYTDDPINAARLAKHGIRYLDCGVSGGVWGRENGYALMVGGEWETVAHVMPVFDALRPDGPREKSFVHAGPVGAGHFTKMVHNGAEYGMMQALGEAFELLNASGLVDDPHAVMEGWTEGTVVRSWLLNLLVKALGEDPGLSNIAGIAEDSGEARWMMGAGIDLAVPLPVTYAALAARFSSRQMDSPAMKAVAALRQQFGGHAIKEV